MAKAIVTATIRMGTVAAVTEQLTQTQGKVKPTHNRARDELDLHLASQVLQSSPATSTMARTTHDSLLIHWIRTTVEVAQVVKAGLAQAVQRDDKAKRQQLSRLPRNTRTRGK